MSVIRAIRYTSFGAYFNEPLEGGAIWRVAQAAEQAAWNAAMRRGGCELRRCSLCNQEAILPREQALCAKCGG